MPLHEILRYTGSHVQEVKSCEWIPAVYKLIGREDINNNLTARNSSK